MPIRRDKLSALSALGPRPSFLAESSALARLLSQENRETEKFEFFITNITPLDLRRRPPPPPSLTLAAALRVALFRDSRVNGSVDPRRDEAPA